jgi:hypothetical protein
MSTAPHPVPASELTALVVRCLEELERGGASGVAALLARHPVLAPRVIERLVLLGELGLLPEAGPARRPPRDVG